MFSAASVCWSLCPFVCLHGNFRTIKRMMMKLGDYMQCNVQKSRPSSNVKVKCQRSRSPGTKKRISATFCLGVVLWDAVLRQFYAGGKISAFWRLVSSVHSSMPNFTPSFVSLYVNTISSERLNVGWRNLAVGALYKNLARVRM